MSRKPAVLELAGGKSQRQRIWDAVRRFAQTDEGRFTIDDLSRTCGIELDPVQEYVKGLSSAGYLRLTNADTLRVGGRLVKKIFELARDNGVEAPRVRRDGTPVTMGRGTEALWAAMTVLDNFNHHLVAEIAQVKPGTAATYCQLLGKAGYLEVVTLGKGKGNGGIATVWRVAEVHRQKPRAPMITRQRCIYDPNTHEIAWAEGADAAADAVEMGEVACG